MSKNYCNFRVDCSYADANQAHANQAYACHINIVNADANHSPTSHFQLATLKPTMPMAARPAFSQTHASYANVSHGLSNAYGI